MSYLCFQLQHVTLTLRGVMLRAPVWGKKINRDEGFVKLRNKAAVTVISRGLEAGLLIFIAESKCIQGYKEQ